MSIAAMGTHSSLLCLALLLCYACATPVSVSRNLISIGSSQCRNTPYLILAVCYSLSG